MSTDVSAELSGLSGKYLTFSLMDELYGINVSQILQIIAIPDITPIPKTPDYIRGVINLRGKIIPVIDLRKRFDLPFQTYNDRTSIVILKLKRENNELFIGIIIDKVLEVLDILNQELEKTPSFGISLNTEYILCMAKVRNKVVTLLNIHQVLTENDMNQIIN